MSKIVAELKALLQVEQGEDETEGAFLVRLVRKANKVTDDEWKSLHKQTQLWVNNALGELEKAEDEKRDPVISMPTDKKGGDGEAASEPTTSTKETSPVSTPAKKAARKTAAKGGAAKKTAAKKTKTATGEGRGRKGAFKLDAKITLLAKENPKRASSKAHKIFAKYQSGMTVEAAIKAGIPWRDLRWDSEHKHIRIA